MKPTAKGLKWYVNLTKSNRYPCEVCGKPTARLKCQKCERKKEPMNPIIAATVESSVARGRYFRCRSCDAVYNQRTTDKCPCCSSYPLAG